MTEMTPSSGNALGLPSATLAEIHDLLTLALDASERRAGYSRDEREARSYVRGALRRVQQLLPAGGLQ